MILKGFSLVAFFATVKALPDEGEYSAPQNQDLRLREHTLTENEHVWKS
jgi:hypothetical protein